MSGEGRGFLWLVSGCVRINLRVETFCRQAQHKYFQIKSGGGEERAEAYLWYVFPLPTPLPPHYLSMLQLAAWKMH